MKSILTFLFIWLISVSVIYSQEFTDAISSDTFSTAIDMFEVPAPMDITLTYDIFSINLMIPQPLSIP